VGDTTTMTSTFFFSPLFLPRVVDVPRSHLSHNRAGRQVQTHLATVVFLFREPKCDNGAKHRHTVKRLASTYKLYT
jgi:hypothetical protein